MGFGLGSPTQCLADDRAKFEQTGDQRYVDKARRRGKVGWDVGRRLEVIPHYRRPHMTLKNSSQFRITHRKGGKLGCPKSR